MKHFEHLDKGAPGPQTIAAAFERHFTPAEIAELWKLDRTTIQRMFHDEPGVLQFGRREARNGKRSYVTLRIPASVAHRVYSKRTI